MRRIVLLFLLCSTAFAATVFRVDPSPVVTTAGNAPSGGNPALYAVPNAGISLCLDMACQTPATAYSDGTGNTACATFSPVTMPWSTTPTQCGGTSGPQGQFGFYLPAGTYYFRVTTASGSFGPYPLSVGVTAQSGTPWSQITGNPFPIPSTYAFTFVSGLGVSVPGGNIVIGNNVFTFAVVPQGVNGTDSGHYLYFSGGTGTAEACLINGGSGTAGQTNGQIIANCANTHSGAWSVQSASGGTQEALIANPNNTVYVPCGLYDLYAPSGGTAVTIPSGSGGLIGCASPANVAAGGSNFVFHFTSGTVFAVATGNNQVTFRNFQVQAANVAFPLTSGSCISVPLNSSSELLISNVTCDSTYNGVSFSGSLHIDHSLFQVMNHGVEIGDGTNYGNVYISDSAFSNISGSHGGVIVGSAGLYFNGTAGSQVHHIFIGNSSGSGYAAIYANNANLPANEVTLTGVFADGNPNYGILTSGGINPIFNWRGSDLHFQAANTCLSLNSSVSNWKTVNSDCWFGTTSGQTGVVISGGGSMSQALLFDNWTVLAQSASQTAGFAISGVVTDLSITNSQIGRTLVSNGGSTINGIVSSAASTGLLFSDNNIVTTGAPIVLGGSETSLVIGPTIGVDNVPGTITISTGTATFPVAPIASLNSTAAVSAVAGVWPGRKISFINTNAAPGAWSAGATIGNTFTPLQNVPVNCFVDATPKIWCKP